MNIKEIPTSYEAMEAYLHEYEKENMKYAKSNTAVLRPVLDFNLGSCPACLRPLFHSFLSALCHDQMRKALNLAKPSFFSVVLLHVVLWTRGFVEEYALPPRQRRLRRTPLDGNKSDLERVRPAFHPAAACPYKSSGYRIGELGPPGLLENDYFG